MIHTVALCLILNRVHTVLPQDKFIDIDLKSRRDDTRDS